MLRARPFEVHADDVLVGKYRTYAEALAATEGLLDHAKRYDHRRRSALATSFSYRFGYRCREVDGASDLAAMGVHG
jgi:hypothetical protein